MAAATNDDLARIATFRARLFMHCIPEAIEATSTSVKPHCEDGPPSSRCSSSSRSLYRARF
jgi:hypothetical protein